MFTGVSHQSSAVSIECEVTITPRDRWTLSFDGKTLNVERRMATPKGDETSHLIFTRQS